MMGLSLQEFSSIQYRSEGDKKRLKGDKTIIKKDKAMKRETQRQKDREIDGGD